MTYLSVVVPAYREPGLREFHRRLVEELNYWWSWDLVYSVGDRETMLTAIDLMVESGFRNRGYPRSVRVRMQRDRGLGEGLQIGLWAAANSNPKYVVTMEADGSNDPADIRKLVAACVGDMSIADKALDSRPAWKRILSLAFKAALRARYNLEPGDYTHLFKCYRASTVRAILPLLRFGGYEGVAETVVRAEQVGRGRIGRASVVYHQRRQGKSKLTPSKMLGMLRLLA